MSAIVVSEDLASKKGYPWIFVGEGIAASFDKKNLKCLQEIEKLNTGVKDKIYFLFNNIVQNLKAKKHWLSFPVESSHFIGDVWQRRLAIRNTALLKKYFP